jgi:hypothetical protein
MEILKNFFSGAMVTIGILMIAEALNLSGFEHFSFFIGGIILYYCLVFHIRQ